MGPRVRPVRRVGDFHLAAKVRVARDHAATRARSALWEGPSQGELADPVDFDEEDPRRNARQDAGDFDHALGDSRACGDNYEWASLSPGMSDAGFPGADASPKWIPGAISQYLSAVPREDLPGERALAKIPRRPYDADEEHRSQIALVLKTIKDRVEGAPEYIPLRLPTAGVAVAAKSCVIHSLTGMVREMRWPEGAARVYASSGFAALQLGSPTGRRPRQLPTGTEAFWPSRASEGGGNPETPWGSNPTRAAHRRRTRGDRSLYGRRKEYRAAVSPISRKGAAPESWGGRPVENLPRVDLLLPPALHTPRRDMFSRGPEANLGPIAHNGFKEAVALSEISRQGACDEELRGPHARIRA